MTQRRFLLYSYISCIALAVGSLGPWDSGPLGFSGASGNGLLTLSGAGVAFLALWRWTASGSRPMLKVVQVSSLVCGGIAVYTIYEIRDFYIGGGYAWVEHLGWGVILTLIAALALTALSLLQHRRSRSEERRFRGPRIGLLAAVVAMLAVGFWTVSLVESDPSRSEPNWFAAKPKRAIPDYALKAAGGKFDGTSWSIWLFGVRNQGDCWGAKSRKDKFPSEEGALGSEEFATCGMNVPPDYWQRPVDGSLGRGRDRRSVLFFLIRTDMSRLEVLIGRRPDGRPQQTRSMKALVISPDQARRARLHPNIGYSVAVVPGQVCIERVAVFDRAGKQVERTPLLPCRPRLN